MSTHLARLAERAAREAIPLDVAIELTSACNFECVHCYVLDRGGRALHPTVPTPRLLRLLEELAELGTLRLALTGGEMLLRPDWAEIAAHARSLGFALRLLTNASLVDEDAARTIAALPAAVDASVYSVDPAVFESITGIPGSLECTLAGIERLRAHGVEVRLKVPLLAPAFEGLEAVFAYAARIGAECAAAAVITPRRSGDRGPLALRLDRQALARFMASSRFTFATAEPCAWRERADEPLCAAGARMAVITAGGEVLACHDLAESAGSILERPFADIWRTSPLLLRLRALRRHDLATCGTCARLRYCGRCSAQALHENGDLLGPSRWACQHAELVEELGLEGEEKRKPTADSSQPTAERDPRPPGRQATGSRGKRK